MDVHWVRRHLPEIVVRVVVVLKILIVLFYLPIKCNVLERHMIMVLHAAARSHFLFLESPNDEVALLT